MLTVVWEIMYNEETVKQNVMLFINFIANSKNIEKLMDP
jgi:hypothetical protein